MTYRFALFSIQRGGLAAGVNVGENPNALTPFVDEVSEQTATGHWRFFGFSERDDDHNKSMNIGIDPQAEAAGIVAATTTAYGNDLEGARIVIDRLDLASTELLAALGAAGAKIMAVGTKHGTLHGDNLDPAVLTTGPDADTLAELGSLDDIAPLSVDSDVAFIGAKMGAVDHTNADAIAARLVVPIALLPFTTKAAVMLQRRQVTVLPDFLSMAGGSLTVDGTATDAASAASQVAEVTRTVTANAEQLPSVTAALQAEAFLATWHEPVFGRPFAP